VLIAPFALPFSLLATLVSVALLAGGGYLIWAWWAGVVVGTGYLLAGAAAVAWTFAGRFVVLLFRNHGSDAPSSRRRAASADRVTRMDGTELHVELYGDPTAPPLVLTHGWGMNSTSWYYAKRELAKTFRVIVWDLPGLGQSREADNKNLSLTKLALDLDAVIDFAGNQPAVLVGHSIGGMIILTWCRLFPEKVARRAAGIVLANTSYTNPVRTTTGARFFTAIQKPVVEPILRVISALSPVVWAMNWLSYLNGTSHIVSMLTGFAGSETREQLDFATRFAASASPDVLARGVLRMLDYDASEVPAELGVPVLVVAGHLDRLTVPEASVAIARAARLARLVELEPAGHASILERNEQFNQIVRSFAADCFAEYRSAAPALSLNGATPAA
jgi:pimeloyl-ACP methyl ester carboxylesterase